MKRYLLCLTLSLFAGLVFAEKTIDLYYYPYFDVDGNHRYLPKDIFENPEEYTLFDDIATAKCGDRHG